MRTGMSDELARWDLARRAGNHAKADRIAETIREQRATMILYHGTTRERADAIERDGLDPDATRRSDPGDFGMGIYLTARRSRAKAYGPAVFRVEVDPSKLARISRPYFLDGFKQVEPETPEERMFYAIAFDDRGEMLTVKGGNREAVSRAVARAFLRAGYTGIATEHSGGEVVVFDRAAFVSVTREEEE